MHSIKCGTEKGRQTRSVPGKPYSLKLDPELTYFCRAIVTHIWIDRVPKEGINVDWGRVGAEKSIHNHSALQAEEAKVSRSEKRTIIWQKRNVRENLSLSFMSL